MPIALNAVNIHSRRRLRLVFSEDVAAGAFTTLSYYTVTCTDAGGVDPSVVAAFVVPNSTAVVEIALDFDLVDGASYKVSAVGVPASAGGSTPAGSELPFRPGVVRHRPVTGSDDILESFLGTDIVWNGEDLVEDPSGDLATVSGRENVRAAIAQRLMSDGLPWDAAYGAKPREYVDGSPLTAQQLRGELAAQAIEDDRVKRASATVLPEDEQNPEQTTIETTIVLIDDTTLPVQTRIRTQ